MNNKVETLKHTAVSVFCGLVISPLAALLLNLAIDLAVWLEQLANAITFSMMGDANEIGWVIIGAGIAKFAVPFLGALKILEAAENSFYSWFPAATFFVAGIYFAIYNVYWYMQMLS